MEFVSRSVKQKDCQRLQTISTMVDANALIKDLSRQVQSNDIESGKKTLTKLKVYLDIVLLFCIQLLSNNCIYTNFKNDKLTYNTHMISSFSYLRKI